MHVIGTTAASDTCPDVHHRPEILHDGSESISYPKPATVERFTDGISIVSAVGDLDSMNYLSLHDGVMSELHSRKCCALIIDLTRVSFCGATALSCLIQAHDAAYRSSIDVRVVAQRCPAQASIWRLLDLRETLTIVPTLTAAWSALRAETHRTSAG